ncbi:MAG: hypothetical protein K940chlam9_01018 [Chlamydiae bacterium]|nr:hypothetical protein [Chlamydiota bacterium]
MIHYSEETNSIYFGEQDLTKVGRYTFNFTPSGLFTLVDKQGEPLYTKALPLFEKSGSQLIWIFFWLTLILFAQTFIPLFPRIQLIFMGMVFVHLFILGLRLTSLLLYGALKPFLFPPQWVRITRKLQKGAGIALLQKHQLERHPGLLVNLALAHQSRGETTQAKVHLQQAHNLCPTHPFLNHLLTHNHFTQ